MSLQDDFDRIQEENQLLREELRASGNNLFEALHNEHTERLRAVKAEQALAKWKDEAERLWNVLFCIVPRAGGPDVGATVLGYLTGRIDADALKEAFGDPSTGGDAA